MSRFRVSLKGFFQDFNKKFFLRKHYPAEHTLFILKRLYPEVDWRRVDFYEGLPWFTPIVAPYVTAQALPDFYSLSRYRIYLRKFNEDDCQCLADIVHEGYHIWQSMYFLKGYGFGFLRGLMVYYNALYVSHGYRNNPFEVPAYEQEFRFVSFCSRNLLTKPVIKNLDAVEELISANSELVFINHQFKYRGNYLYLFASFLMCLVITVLRPVADVLIYLVSLIARIFLK